MIACLIVAVSVCAGPLEGIERTEKSCSYNEYFNQVDKDGLGPTDAIIRESNTTCICNLTKLRRRGRPGLVYQGALRSQFVFLNLEIVLCLMQCK